MRLPTRMCLITTAIACLFTPAHLIAAPADDVLYVTRRTMQPVKPAPGKPLGPYQHSTYVLYRTDAQGNNPKSIYTTPLEIRGLSTSPDGARIVCQETRTDVAGAAAESRLVVLKSDGSLTTTIDVLKLGVRVFGAPVFLPDSKHLGLTLINLPARPTPAAPITPGRRSTQDLTANQWNAGNLSAQPFIATIDLGGTNLKRLGPGLAPSWSPDGQTILYTDYSFDDRVPQTTPPHARLFAMTADGKMPHPIAPDHSAAGSFSPDGKSILYIGNLGPYTSDLFIADADGASPRRLNANPGTYVWPRFLAGSLNHLEVVCTPSPEHAPGSGMEKLSGKSIFCLSTDGSLAAVKVAPNNPLEPTCSLNLDVETLLYRLARPTTPAHHQYAAPPPNDSPTRPPLPPGAERLPNIPQGPTNPFHQTPTRP